MKVYVATVAGLLTLVACVSNPRAPLVGITDSEGFEAFATPRSFDGPGTIFRIDGDGKRFLVGEITFKVKEGVEELPKASSSRVFSLSQFIEALGASATAMPASIKANLSRTATTTIEATTAQRKFVSDDDVVTAMLAWANRAKPNGDSVYYLIRETISTPGLVYKVDKNWLNSVNVDIQTLEVAGYKGEAKASAGDVLEMNRTFSQPLNVWFKAEKIVVKPVLGAAPGQYIIERSPEAGNTLGL